MHQDYIVRMMQQMAIFITRVFRLRQDEEFEAAHAEVLSAYGHLTGLPASLVHGLSEDDLLAMLSSRGVLPIDRCIGLAELLREEGEIFLDEERHDEATPRFVKALRFYLEGLRDSDDLRSADIPGLDQTIERISWYPVSPQTRDLLLPYLEASGQFDKLENVLAAWNESGDAEAENASTEILRRLLQRSDAELIVGGVTRSELEESIAELSAR